GFDRHIQFVGDYLRQGRLAKAWWAIEQYMIECFATAARGLHRDLNILLHALLTDIFVQTLRSNARFDARVFIKRGTGHDALGLARHHHSFCTRVGHQVLAARPLGALRTCREARNSFSKLLAPASRFASATADSAVRAS